MQQIKGTQDTKKERKNWQHQVHMPHMGFYIFYMFLIVYMYICKYYNPICMNDVYMARPPKIE